jgi:hypothetical protein
MKKCRRRRGGHDLKLEEELMKPDGFLGIVIESAVLRFGRGAGNRELWLALPRYGAAGEGEDVCTHGAAGFRTRAPVGVGETDGLKWTASSVEDVVIEIATKIS